MAVLFRQHNTHAKIVEAVCPASLEKQLMGNHAGKVSLCATRWKEDCEVMRFLRGRSIFACFIHDVSAYGLRVWFVGLVCDVNFWNLWVL